MNQGKEKERLVEIKVLVKPTPSRRTPRRDHIQEVARYVNEKIEEVLEKDEECLDPECCDTDGS